MKGLYLTIFFAFVSLLSYGQVTGMIADDSGEVLPLVSIYVQGTSTGTTSNLEGNYRLSLSEGTYEIVFQFIGYETVVRSVTITDDNPQQLDIVLSEQSLLLSEVVIAADAEDPAYRVIREAIKKRAYYGNLHEEYSCEVYVKGYNKILDAPKKIMGMDVGDMDGALDSNRQGMVYLSESISDLYFSRPDTYKEVLTSSKVSGDDQGYSFNSAKEMQFDIYQNTETLQRAIILPLADNALNYYRYRLDGTFYDQNGNLINKIEVLPKSSSDPVVSGYIYIAEDLWNVHSLDLLLPAEASQIYFLDTLRFEQVFIPIADSDARSLFSNIISFDFGLFGFKVVGEFTAIYSNYNYDPDLDPDFFNHVSHIVEEGSNERDSLFWESARPVPLTQEESIDYVVKDSIFQVRDSPEYKDSIDRENNRFSIGDIIGGYSYQNTKDHNYFQFGSPLGGLSFNTVQGFKTSIDIDYQNYFDEKETRRILYYSTLDYGLSEKKLRYKGQFIYRPNRTTSSEYSLFGGSGIYQFNGRAPISENLNTAYSLITEQNFAKYYAKNQIGLRWQTDIVPGVVLNSTVRYEDRNRLINNSDYVTFDRDDRIYTSNDPIADSGLLTDHEALLLDLSTRIRFGQKYTMFPDRRFSDGYNGPELRLSYRAAIAALGGDVDYHRFGLSLSDYLNLGTKGDFRYFLNAGTFLSKGNTQFVDFKHFMGNQLLIYPLGNSIESFYNLPYYDFSTDGNYLQAHVNHDFNGWILGRIPFLKKTGFSLVAGAKFLDTSTSSPYQEFHVGLSNVGWDLFRIFRVDSVWSRYQGDTQWNLRVGIGFQ